MGQGADATVARGAMLEPNKETMEPGATGPGWNPSALTTEATLPEVSLCRPNTTRLSSVPTYTLPFAMVGVENLTYEPRSLVKLMAEIGRVVGVELAGRIDGPEYSVARAVGRDAGHRPVARQMSRCWLKLESADSRPLWSAKAFIWSCAAEKYTVLLKYAGIPNSGPTAPASD